MFLKTDDQGAETVSTGTSEIEEIRDDVEILFRRFKNFNVAPSAPYDHNFFYDSQLVDQKALWISRLNQNTKLRERIDLELQILEANLPKSIFVRAYEDKRDILRAVIIGQEGTPNAYRLFFFDIFIPKDYPNKHPQIFHNSTCEAPNMKIRLFDNNFTSWMSSNPGSRMKWDSNTNICDVLTFIQKSVLVMPKIYFKDDQKDFWYAHKDILKRFLTPPRGFENFVYGYFRNNSHDILMQFKSKFNLEENKEMNELFFQLVKAFERNGSYCKHLVHGVKEATKREHDTNDFPDFLLDRNMRGDLSKTSHWIDTFDW